MHSAIKERSSDSLTDSVRSRPRSQENGGAELKRCQIVRNLPEMASIDLVPSRCERKAENSSPNRVRGLLHCIEIARILQSLRADPCPPRANIGWNAILLPRLPA